MPKKNNQAQDLLDEFKGINAKAKDYLSGLHQKIAELDLKYARLLVNNDINILKAAKRVLEDKK
jgi:hypothetical protein